MAIKWRNKIASVITFSGFCAGIIGIGLFLTKATQFIYANFDDCWQFITALF